MRLVRFIADGRTFSGHIDGVMLVADGVRRSLDSVRLLVPCTPSKIIGVGRNYAEHAAEMSNPLPKEPLLFFKPPSALLDPGGDIIYPAQSADVHYEGELAVVIAKRCRDVPRNAASDFVLGYTICNDVTARDLQSRDGQWARAKGFDTFAPLGPCIASGLDPAALRVTTRLNGELKQDCSVSKLIFDVPTLIEYASQAFTLEPGDVISTGTPSGVGPMKPGDVVTVAIEGIGELTNRVVPAKT